MSVENQERKVFHNAAFCDVAFEKPIAERPPLNSFLKKTTATSSKENPASTEFEKYRATLPALSKIQLIEKAEINLEPTGQEEGNIFEQQQDQTTSDSSESATEELEHEHGQDLSISSPQPSFADYEMLLCPLAYAKVPVCRNCAGQICRRDFLEHVLAGEKLHFEHISSLVAKVENLAELNADGFVTKQYTDDNSVYRGAVVDGMRHGEGVLRQENGDFFFGMWEADMRCGHGMLKTEDRVFYGEWKDDKRNGCGVLVFQHGDTHCGFWCGDEMTGSADIQFANHPLLLSYSGQVFQGCRYGLGVMKYRDGSCYDGYWFANCRHGQGRLIAAGGRFVYHGDYHNDMRQGYGRVDYINGDFYEGEWANNLFHGTGVYTWYGNPHCSVYSGQCVQGVRHGFGIMFYRDKTRYEGHWANGYRVQYINVPVYPTTMMSSSPQQQYYEQLPYAPPYLPSDAQVVNSPFFAEEGSEELVQVESSAAASQQLASPQEASFRDSGSNDSVGSTRNSIEVHSKIHEKKV